VGPFVSVLGARMHGMSVMRLDANGAVDRRPTKPRVSVAIGRMEPGRHVVLDRIGEPGDWYIQVWMRPGNTFQLEYRDGTPAEHYQTLTASRDKVVEAFLGWFKRDPSWSEGFDWVNIAAMFTETEGAGVPGEQMDPPSAKNSGS
jgi:hypothetical protein